uniref:N-acetylgalactosaminide beta-1,3-galactosyltransferase n=1 Tax=Parastrongyloides trichosuri TaxID=131310 RepID=A0A0N4ZLK2_PARTI
MNIKFLKIFLDKKDKIKILCLITAHPTKTTSTLNHIKRTWLQHCDYSIYMKVPRERFSIKNGKKFKVLKLNMIKRKMSYWEKTKIYFKNIQKRYRNLCAFNWLLKVNDNSFVIIENLKRLLKNYDSNKSIYFGYHNKSFEMMEMYKEEYIPGGSGYVISINGIKNMVEKKYKSKCSGSVQGFEDIDILKCFENYGISRGNSIDEKGLQTFLPPAYKKDYYQSVSRNNKQLYNDYTLFPNGQREIDVMSEYPISFHNIDYKNVYFLYFIFYKGKIYYE